MTDFTLSCCPSTLKEGFDTFSPLALRRLFGGKSVNHVLPFTLEYSAKITSEVQRVSISGVQEKVSLLLERNELKPVKENEHGQYILKPIPNSRFRAVNEIPANEHLTMQIAKQVYKIETAENSLIFFPDSSPAYLTKRFDYQQNNGKLMLEDFATLSGKSKLKGGSTLKYEGSYEDMAKLIKKSVVAYPVEIEKFFRLVLFNYLFSNGDAHLKNFSLIETSSGDMVLSPAYDLLCTRLHVNDSDMATSDGLFSEDFETESFQANAFYAYDDFLAFAIKIGINQKRAEKILQFFQRDHSQIHELTSNSFLSEETKKIYTDLYFDKLKRLRYSFLKD
ncbi:serine/threonine-protein kinase HipA [Arcicella aurantiaca]|uniref:Serine/threonine-protein kinase HipA n=1 Tax=Arcicella aurantiaca TaxID=591202 RepID=A0A316EDI3_9BACT|nr:HipA domain-containing protein [Arcicella aurantiaca]PWK28206.1 serine/threonine-protein kinase HipA [Arcicella aurantiaca]